MSGMAETAVASSERADDWRIVELTEVDAIARAAEDVAIWGYQRPIAEYEIQHGSWFRFGVGVVLWFEPPDPRVPTWAFVHVAVAPRLRPGHWPVRKVLRSMDLIGELIGADRLVFGAQVGADEVADYVLRLGWRQEGPIFVRLLGG